VLRREHDDAADDQQRQQQQSRAFETFALGRPERRGHDSQQQRRARLGADPHDGS
jgi:hypothetical protein